MHQSDAIPVNFQGHPALLSVIRNDGWAWGRLTFPGQTVPPPQDVAVFDPQGEDTIDLYDLPDSDALDLLQEAVESGVTRTTPALAWL